MSEWDTEPDHYQGVVNRLSGDSFQNSIDNIKRAIYALVRSARFAELSKTSTKDEKVIVQYGQYGKDAVTIELSPSALHLHEAAYLQYRNDLKAARATCTEILQILDECSDDVDGRRKRT